MYFGSIHSGPHRLSEHAGCLQDRAAAVQPPDLCGNVPPDRPGCTGRPAGRRARRSLQHAAARRQLQDRSMAQHLQAGVAGRPRSLYGSRERGRKAAQACAGGQRGAARPAGRCAHAERGVAGAAAAAAGRSVSAGCRRRHRQGHLAGTAHCLCDGGQDLRLFSAAAAADRQGAAACGRGRPRQGAQGPSAGGRGRHEPGAGADRRRLLWQDRPAPYPQGSGTGGFCRQGRAAAAHRGPAAELSARRCGDGKPQPDAQCPAAAARHCRKAGLRGAHRDALQQKAGRFRPRTSGRQLGYLGHGPQRADDGPRQERRQNLSQPREKQLRPPPADGAAAHRRCGGGGRKDRAGRV